MDREPVLPREYLAALIATTLLKEVGPSLPPGRERLLLETACALIKDLARDDRGPASLPDDLLAAAAHILHSAPAVARAAGVSPGESAVARIARLANSDALPQAAVAPLLNFLDRVLAHSEAELRSAPTLHSAYELSARGTLGGQFDAQNLPAAKLEHYLTGNAAFGAYASASVRRLSSGMSKETYLAELRSPGRALQKLIIRKDAGFSCLMTTVIDEFPLLAFVNSFGLPVPRALLLEPDVGICGAPFMVIEASAGTSDPGSWGDAAVMRSVAVQLIGFLADLHSISLEPFQSAPPTWLDPVHMCRSVQGLRVAWEACDIHDQPLLDAVLEWLEDENPREPRKRVLVHADAGFHNLLIADGKLNAVLDWETCHIGYPEEDLLGVRPFLERVMPWAEVVAAYQNRGGEYREGFHPQFYSVFVLARTAVSLFNIRAGMRAGNRAIDTRDAYIASRYTERVVSEAFKAMLKGIAERPRR